MIQKDNNIKLKIYKIILNMNEKWSISLSVNNCSS